MTKSETTRQGHHTTDASLHFGVNLLYDAFTQAQGGKSITSLTIFVTASLFILLSTTVFIFSTIYLNTIKTRNKTLKQNLKKLTSTIELIYNINLREQYIADIQNPNYAPANIIKILNNIITPEGQITSYQLNNQGNIHIRITTNSLHNAALIWFYLISNKQMITQLNLHSFTFDSENNSIDFTLRGKLDIKKISEKYANQTR